MPKVSCMLIYMIQTDKKVETCQHILKRFVQQGRDTSGVCTVLVVWRTSGVCTVLVVRHTSGVCTSGAAHIHRALVVACSSAPSHPKRSFYHVLCPFHSIRYVLFVLDVL